MRAGLSRKRGSRLRKEHLRFTAAWDCVTSPPKGSTFQIALPMVPHAGKMPSRWLSHRGVTSFRHSHAPPPVSGDPHPQLQGSSAGAHGRCQDAEEVAREPGPS